MAVTSDFSINEKIKKIPNFLHYRGNLELLKKPKISIVGSRKMSIYTKTLISSLSSKFSKAGICVVSGGAIGCDICANANALPNTIAIFANGLNQIYPKTNEKIIKEIYKNALALSEYEDDFMPSKYSFLQRNRIVVGLSDALIVAQADLKSGTMQSAKIAKEAKIPIYVFAQRINDSLGTNLLLKKVMQS